MAPKVRSTNKRQYHRVATGNAEKTAGGLTKSDITKNSRGEYVSKAKRKEGLKRFKNPDSAFAHWNHARNTAKKELNLDGFVAIKKGGKGIEGEYYKLTKKHYENARKKSKKGKSQNKVKKK